MIKEAKIEKIDTTEEVLKRAAQNMVFDESFKDLIEEEYTDVAKIGNMMLEFEDMDLLEEEYGRGQYLKEELYATRGPEVKLSDIFITKPQKSIKQKKGGSRIYVNKSL